MKLKTSSKEYMEHLINLHPKHTGYFTHDNGGEPFLVFVPSTLDWVYIYKVPKNGWTLSFPECWNRKLGWSCCKPILFRKYKPRHIYIGNGKEAIEQGNSILLKMSNGEYIFIGHEMYKFKMNDTIVKYFSLVGANDVPNPIILGKRFVYFLGLGERVYYDRELFMYSKNDNYANAYINEQKTPGNKMKVEMIQKRI